MGARKLWTLIAAPGLAVSSLLLAVLILNWSTANAASGGFTAPILQSSESGFVISRTVFAEEDVILIKETKVDNAAWAIETIDSDRNVGQFTSLALASTPPYTPHISYRDVTSNSLKYTSLSGSIWFNETIDEGCGTTSLALIQANPYTPAISYDGCQRHTKFAWISGTNWISQEVSGLDAGSSSLALEPAEPYTPRISHFWRMDDIRSLYYVYPSGTPWVSDTWVYTDMVEPPNSEAGWESSLVLEPTYPYTPHISYRYDYKARGQSDLRFAWLNNTIWLTETIDSAGDVGRNPSLALDNSGNPHISYFDNTNNIVKYATLSGTTWFSETIDFVGEPPDSKGWNSLELSQSNVPYISYYDAANGNLNLAYLRDALWITRTVDSEGDVGRFNSLALDGVGCPHISYYDDTNGNLKYVHIPVTEVANFFAQPTVGIAPLTISFSNTSICDYSSSLWDFGDGLTSTLSSPTHSYATSGTYTVTLTVSGPGGTDALTRTNYITAYQEVKANFTVVPTTGIAPLAVAFTNMSTGNYTSSLWGFGDGLTDTENSPSHTYTTTGLFTVTLTVSGSGGVDITTRTDYIKVNFGIHLPLIMKN